MHDQVFVHNTTELRNWLLTHHEQTESVWLVRYKKGYGEEYLTYTDIVDQLLCFGWVDSLPRKLDEAKTMLRISPRNPKSNWSGVNKRKIARLEAVGLLHPSGLRLVETAKANGCWDFLNDVDALIVPDDLQRELDATERATHYWSRFPPSSKRGILEWIKLAKTDKTRRKRILETAQKAAENRKANFPEGRDAGPVE